MKRYDMKSPRERNEKTYWHRVGTAFEGDKGFTCYFDSLPLPDKDGRCVVKLYEATPKDETPEFG